MSRRQESPRLGQPSETASADWLSIHEASRLLGVHISTVRDWADAGVLPSYRTPGGHRRLSRVALEKFLAKQRAATNPHDNPTEQSLARMRDELHAHSDWLKDAAARPDAQERARQREFGQKLLACVVEFVQEPGARERWLDEGRRIAHQYGGVLIASGVSAGSAARATIHFRQMILKTVLDVHLGSRAGDEADASLFQRVSVFLDEILLVIVEGYP